MLTCIFCKALAWAVAWTEDGEPVCSACTNEWANDEMASCTLMKNKP